MWIWQTTGKLVYYCPSKLWRFRQGSDAVRGVLMMLSGPSVRTLVVLYALLLAISAGIEGWGERARVMAVLGLPTPVPEAIKAVATASAREAEARAEAERAEQARQAEARRGAEAAAQAEAAREEARRAQQERRAAEERHRQAQEQIAAQRRREMAAVAQATASSAALAEHAASAQTTATASAQEEERLRTELAHKEQELTRLRQPTPARRSRTRYHNKEFVPGSGVYWYNNR